VLLLEQILHLVLWLGLKC